MAGSSAGAIVCAVVASGASMEEALEATKVLAQDCRSRGTAFRLGVYFSTFLLNVANKWVGWAVLWVQIGRWGFGQPTDTALSIF